MTESGDSRRPAPGEMADDEIDLGDLVAVLVKRRRLILVGTVAAVLIAVAYTLLQPTRFQAETYLEIGSLPQLTEEGSWEVDRIAKAESVAGVMRSRGPLVGEKVFPEAGPGLTFGEGAGWKVEARSGGLVRVQLSEVEHADVYLEFLRSLNEFIRQAHAQKIDQARSRLQQKRDSLQENLDELRHRKEELQKQFEKWVQGKDQGKGIGEGRVRFLRDMVGDLRNRISDFESQLSEVEAQLEAIESTRVLVEPRFAEKAVTANHRLHIALGFVLGVFLSVFLAFLAEFWANNRDRIREAAS